MIKNVSNTFKANCKKDSVKYREYIVIDNKEVDIKGDLSDTAYKDNTFFGKFNLKMLKFETENDIDYKKKEFVYYKEVNGEAIKIGTFIVTEVKDSDTFESVNVTAYDYGLKFANPYTTNLDYKNGNITMFQVVQEICNNCDIELENTSLPNGDFIVDSNQFVNGEQFGDVIAQASGINGMFATINSNDKLEFIFTNETNEIIEDYVELDDKRDTWPITSVLVAPSEDLATAGSVLKDEALIEQYGEHWLKIYSYGFAYSTEKCQQLVNAIFNQVKGFAYSSFKSEYSFLPYLSLGDKIKFKNKEGKLVNSIILRYETSYDEITLEAPSIINASVDYELPETPETTSKKALFKVDQALGEIDAISKKVVDISSTASGIGTLNITNGSKGILHKLDIYGTLELPIVGGQLGTSATKVGYSKVGTSLVKSFNKYIKPLIVGQFNVNSFKIIIKQGDNTKEYSIDDMKNLSQIGTTHDTFEYLDGKCSITRRIGLNNDGTKYILDTPHVEQLKDLNIEVPEGDYTISVNYNELYLDVEYLTKNEYTDAFAKQVDVSSMIKVASDEVLIQSKREILDSGDELIASINTKSSGDVLINASKTINFEGKEFNVSTEKMKITIGSGEEKKDLINANGVLTNLIYTGYIDGSMFVGSGDYIPLGRVGGGDTADTQRNKCTFAFKLPENYVVQSAKIYLSHAPTIFTYGENQSITGYSRNLKLYKGNPTNLKMHFDFNTSMSYTEGASYNEIYDAFGSDGFTGNVSNTTNVQSIDIKDYIDTDKENFLSIYDGNYTTYTTNEDIFSHTGSVFAYLEIIGYSQI